MVANLFCSVCVFEFMFYVLISRLPTDLVNRTLQALLKTAVCKGCVLVHGHTCLESFMSSMVRASDQFTKGCRFDSGPGIRTSSLSILVLC